MRVHVAVRRCDKSYADMWRRAAGEQKQCMMGCTRAGQTPLTADFGCSVYKKVASLAANQEGLPEPSAQSAAPPAAPAQTQADQGAGLKLSSSQEQPTQHASASAVQQSGGSTDGIVLQSEGSQAPQRESKPLGRSLFQGAMRRLAGKQSEGAPEVQVKHAMSSANLPLLTRMSHGTARAPSWACTACCCRQLPLACDLPRLHFRGPSAVQQA